MYEFCWTENGPGRALAQNDAPPGPSGLATSPPLPSGTNSVVGSVIMGSETQIDPGEPIDKQLYEFEPEEAGRVKSTPGSHLRRCSTHCKKDHERLLQGGCSRSTLLRPGSPTSGNVS